MICLEIHFHNREIYCHTIAITLLLTSHTENYVIYSPKFKERGGYC